MGIWGSEASLLQKSLKNHVIIRFSFERTFMQWGRQVVGEQ